MQFKVTPFPQMRSFPSHIFRSHVRFPAVALSGEEAVSNADECRSLAREFYYGLYDNLYEFPYVYFTAGVTEGISWSLRGRETAILLNEYRFLYSQPGVRPWPNLPLSSPLFLSSPFSGTGRHEDLFDVAFKERSSITLDASYLCASNLHHHRKLPPNVDTVLFGVTKSHDLADVRFGVMFTKTELPGHHIAQYEYGYISGSVLSTLRSILRYEHNKLYRDNEQRVREAYKRAGLIETDTLLFATDLKTGSRVPWYYVTEVK